MPTNTGKQVLPTLYTVNADGPVRVTLQAVGYADEYLEVEQSSEASFDKITITFSHARNNAPSVGSVVPEFVISGGGTVTYGRLTCARTGNPYTYTVTLENVLFQNVTSESVVTVSYGHQVLNSRGQVTHECSYEGTAKIGDLETHPTITLAQQ